MHDLIISFQSPRAGWLPLQITSGDIVVNAEVSYTPNDFLEELVNAALGVAEYEGSFTARIHEEPEEQIVRLARHEDTVTVTVERPNHAEALLSFQGPAASVVVPIWRALRRLESDEHIGEWRRDFPVAQMRSLGEAVERLKAPAA